MQSHLVTQPQRSPQLQNTRRGKPAERCDGTAAPGADDAKHNRHPDSLPAPASPDMFRTTSQGQLLGTTARRLAYFVAFCFRFFFLTDRLCGCVPVRLSRGKKLQANKITSIHVNTHTHTHVYTACRQKHLDVHESLVHREEGDLDLRNESRTVCIESERRRL